MKYRVIATGITCLMLSACQTTYDDVMYEVERADTTTIAAATGGVLGAGLGAIIGSQSGDAGVGLVIGAAAGSGTGALVGHALQKQEDQMAAQNERIAWNEKRISASQRELEALRNVRHDIAADDFPESYTPPSSYTAPTQFKNTYTPAPVIQERSIQERGIQERSIQEAVRTFQEALPVEEDSGIVDDVSVPVTEFDDSGLPGPSARGSLSPQALSNEECQLAEQELKIARKETEQREKLFRLRRALRLCPHNADYHVGLALLYLKLNRTEDAQFEFNEALRLDPSHQEAQSQLEALQRDRY